VDPTQPTDQPTVSLHEIHPTRPDVADVERDVAEAEKVLGPVAGPSPYAEKGHSTALGHVLDYHGYALARAV
jgi:hypothetical protein